MSHLSPSAAVRQQARLTLKGNYVPAVFGFMILVMPFFIIIGVVDIIDAFLLQGFDDPTVLGVMSILIETPLIIILGVLFSPLLNGYVRMFYLSALSREMRLSDMFYYFEREKYQKAILLNLSCFVRLILPGLICFIPLFVFQIFSYSAMSDFTATVLFKDFSFILTVLSSILLVLYSLRYFIVYPLFCMNEQADIPELFKVSKEIMRSQSHSAMKLVFSFTPWMLLCLTILPMLYVIPYMTQALCIGSKWFTQAGYERNQK